MTSSVLLTEELDEATVLLTLNRPERRNALSIELMESLCQTIDRLAAEPRCRIVILRGAGPSFCAGLDLIEAADTTLSETSAEWVARTFETLSNTSLVTIAAAHSAAYGGGAGLLACCDFALASEDLQICFPEVRRGLVPALVSVVLRDRLSDGHLRELLFVGEAIGAAHARQIGFVHRVVSAERLLDEARTLATTILKGAPDAVRQTKRLLRELRPIEQSQLFAQALTFHKQSRQSEEAREGLVAFREHREPDWPSS